jgi:hypothetical protein
MKLKIPYWQFLLGPSLAFGLGFLFNALVRAANHGQMPVLWPGGCPPGTMGDDIIHSCMVAPTRLKFLADWIITHSGVASPGDFLEWLFEATFWPGLII